MNQMVEKLKALFQEQAERSERLLQRRGRGEVESGSIPTGRGPGMRAPLSDDETSEDGY